ncbi:MAG: hypothetical protein IKH20_05445 [Clostridiales bacterium]|nr:hypothetical protein [Clostridiales bacterium]
MKKLLVTALAACTIIGSFASVSMAYHTMTGDVGHQNRYNGSYYYDIGYAKAYSDGDKVRVKTELLKNGKWQAGKVTGVSAGTVTCWSNTIQGSGANGARGYFV